MLVSRYRNTKIWVDDFNTCDIIHEIKNGVVKHEVLDLRQLLSDGKKELYAEQKKTLLAFTPSATFNRRRKLPYLKEHNGNIILDVDGLPISLLHAVKALAILCPYTFACFISPGAEGLKIIVRTNATSETHKAVFAALADYYENLLNVFIDESGKDIPRLCFYSYDPEAYLNVDSEIFIYQTN